MEPIRGFHDLPQQRGWDLKKKIFIISHQILVGYCWGKQTFSQRKLAVKLERSEDGRQQPSAVSVI
jgi:hypothetical protein